VFGHLCAQSTYWIIETDQTLGFSAEMDFVNSRKPTAGALSLSKEEGSNLTQEEGGTTFAFRGVTK